MLWWFSIVCIPNTVCSVAYICIIMLCIYIIKCYEHTSMNFKVDMIWNSMTLQMILIICVWCVIIIMVARDARQVECCGKAIEWSNSTTCLQITLQLYIIVYYCSHLMKLRSLGVGLNLKLEELRGWSNPIDLSVGASQHLTKTAEPGYKCALH